MSPDRASKIIVTTALTGFVFIFAFNLGRLTNGTVKIEDGCKMLSYSTPFKGTLP